MTVAEYDPEGVFYLADPEDGTPLDRTAPEVDVRRPDRERLRKFSVRIPQLAIAAVSLQQIVNRWQAAIRDPEMMTVFRCEVLADPQSTRQALTPALIARARTVHPFDMALQADKPVFAGLDTGDRCWFVGAENESAHRQRIIWAERIAADNLLARTVALVNTLGVQCLFVDAGPLRDTSRAIVFALNGLDGEGPTDFDAPERAYIRFTNGLIWNGPAGRWENLRAAAVEFTLKPGSGLRHKLGRTDEGRLYPVISASREDTIGGVINDLLTAQEGVVELIDKKLRTEPRLLLPRYVQGSPAAVEDLANHFLAGSKRTEDGGFVDKIENHYLLAAGYARMARMLGGVDTARGNSVVAGIGSGRMATPARRDF